MDEQEQTPENPVSTKDTGAGIPTPQEPVQQPTEVIQEQTTTQPLPTTPQSQPSTEPPKKSGNPLMLILIVLILALLGVGGYFLFQNTQLKSLLSQPTPTPEITESPPSPTPDLLREPNGSDETANWEIYTNTKYGFSLRVPQSYQLPSAKTDFGMLGDKIDFGVSENSVLNCVGDCPVIDKSESITVAGLSATKVEGYTGEIGGCVAMRYITYEFLKDDNYIDLTLNATTCNNDGVQPQGIVEHKNEDIQSFDQILSTFQFTE